MSKDKETAKMMYQNNDVIKMDSIDGKKHDVVFKKFCPIKIGDLNCYIGKCYDFTYNHDVVVLLNYYDNCWYRIPVYDTCEYLSYHFNNNKLKHLDASNYELGERIRLAQPMKLIPPESYIDKYYGLNKNDETKQPLADLIWEDDILNDPTFAFEFFVPINTNGETNVLKNTFACKHLYGKYDWYHFEKTFDNPKLIIELMKGINENHLNEHGVKEYDFDVTIPDGIKAVKDVKKPDGSTFTIGATSIPGTYSCKVYYSDFIDENYYRFANNNDKLVVKTNKGQYHEYFDTDKVWKESGNKVIELVSDLEQNKRGR